ncbi:MAG: sugar ABC transporter permease [bacterium]|nr:sugar ABC transporter permease [bacterium]
MAESAQSQDVVQRRPQSAARTGLRLNNSTREAVNGWLFVMPWVIGFALFTAIPMVFSFYTSFTNYNLIRSPQWVGTRHYENIFTNDPYFWKSLENTFWMVGIRVPIVMTLALAIAILLNTKIPYERVFRTIVYLPNVLAGAAAVYLWQWILSPTGLLNQALEGVGIDGPSWFTNPNWTKPALVVMGLWWIGGNIIIYLAAIKGVPQTLYEAASIDGASPWHKLRYITLPMISPTIFFQVITSIIGTFQIFTTAYIIITTGGLSPAEGGPGRSLLFYVIYLYNRAFGKVGSSRGFDMGYASALAWILFVIILAITLFQLWLSKRWVYYESGEGG